MIAHPDHSVNATLLLASASPRRRELIKLLGLPVETTSADIDEVPLPGEQADEMARRLSLEKARAASLLIPARTLASGEAGRQAHPSSFILLASDTVVSLDGEPLGKPRDAAEARSMLRRLRGRTHQVYTAITLIDLQSTSAHRAVLEDAGRFPRPSADPGEYAAADGGSSKLPTITDLACSNVPMRAYTDAEIEAYIASGDPFDKAGAYAIQHDGFSPVENFAQCYANVMGLPLCHIVRALRKFGVEVPNDVPALCQAHIRYECPAFESILMSDE